MVFAWDSYAKLADDLWKDEHYEVHSRYRAAASRFYYAAHWQVKIHLECRLRTRFGITDVHSAVVTECRSSREPKLRVIGEKLLRLKEKRQHADYDAERDFRDVDIGTARRCYFDIDSALRGAPPSDSPRPLV